MSKLLLLLATASTIGLQAPAQGNSQRLTGMAYYSDPSSSGAPFALTDTAYFSYSGTRGSAYDFHNFRYSFPDAFEYAYFWQSLAPNNTYRRTNLVEADVLSYFHRDETSDIMELYSKKSIGFDAQGVPDAEGIALYSSTALQIAGYYSYDAEGRISGIVHLSNADGPMDTVGRKGIRYQPGGALMMDSTDTRTAGVWQPSSRNLYATWPNGDLQQKTCLSWESGTWYEWQRDSFAYNPDGTVKKAWYFRNGTATAPAELKQIDSLVYTAGVDNYTFSQSWYVSGGVAAPYTRFRKFWNAAMVPDSFISYHYDAGTWKPAYGAALDLNASGNPTVQRRYEVVGGSYQAYARHCFYYESYTPAGIAGTAAPTALVQAYPNPATGLLSLAWQQTTASQPCVLTLTNSAGQALVAARYGAGTNACTLDLGGYPAGSYFVALSQGGRVIARQQITRQ